MKQYNLINNSLGWLCFVIAAVTYLLTLEPTASFWDCPEYISQAFKLEVGHPPGNPIWIMMARVAVNFAGGDISLVPLMVNASSAIFSAGTILLLFWTITCLTRKLLVKDGEEVSLTKMIVIMSAGLCGALAYAWSDTFWFSAVEAEVYAFSSFCTALVFWLILKWEARADKPHSDRYLVLIAYVIGISIAVHLLNLLCIPAIVLVIYYRKWSDTTALGSLAALGVSVIIIALILFGLVPGFVEMSQYFELFFVNVCHLGYNWGVLIYALLTVAAFIWCIREMYAQRSPLRMKLSFIIAITLSGIPFIGESLWVPVVIILALVAYFSLARHIPVRVLTVTILSCFVIFIGYTSYALLLIRSSANTPMNQNQPDNVFTLASYLNREQYGETPLLYGRTLNSSIVYQVEGQTPKPVVKGTKKLYGKVVKNSPEEPDAYVNYGVKKDYMTSPELDMLFPRIHSQRHTQAYVDWIDLKGKPVEATVYIDENGDPLQKSTRMKPTMAENLRFFLIYQLNQMYWRYFMWNFAGRQNDIQGNGEVNNGNWISGIPFIDNMRLGDQSLLPAENGSANKGHNVFYMLPLILGLIGLGWQAFTSKKGIEQFWVVFFLFFMTGIAIVLYLNQTPTQPRERDYAFAGSFYAYSIWIGLGVAGLWHLCLKLLKGEKPMFAACFAAFVGLIVPVQMVSQTWDDHDRSGRYTARDFGFNYLNSLDENAVIFTNGDNDTFPLWYAQEVEGERRDVKVVNLSYLTTDWYVNQIKKPTYEAPAIDMLARPADYAYDRLQFNYFLDPDTTKVDALTALAHLYDPQSSKNAYGLPMMRYPNMYIPVDKDAAVKAGRITGAEAAASDDIIDVNMIADRDASRDGGLTLSQVISLDILATSAANGWNRPVYFATTVPTEYYLGLSPYMRSTGMAYEVTPLRNANGQTGVNTDKMYRNVTEKFRWGGLDVADKSKLPYLDETVRRMVTSTRSQIIDLARALLTEGVMATDSISDLTGDRAERARAFAADRYAKAAEVLDLMMVKLPVEASPLGLQVGLDVAQLYATVDELTGTKTYTPKAVSIIENELNQYTRNIIYYQSLKPWQYLTLPYNDRWIDQYYYLRLLQEYSDLGADAEAYMQKAAARGVNFDRQAAFLDRGDS
ncbi:MAG: DUF2723 domain-containing protein [Candidatus Amulumruptor caecigallinarius]|nr:DUF2723 domain-containing protein [Candidatus Amulumruptor caecigallinarius]MCM1395980.1 DUF2723 domain-containing protein [Candidatus Amulumruptor caecigallinarius]MCM1453012.1 DUF2723 domain-containing protein [bacterium]